MPVDSHTISGSTVTLKSVGARTLVVRQGGDDTYSPAAEVSRSFTVRAADGTTEQLYLPSLVR